MLNVRSLALAVIAAASGIGIYLFDNHLKDPLKEGILRWIFQGFEIMVMGPGLGILTWSVHQNLVMREQRARREIDQERGRRFLLLGRIAASVAHEIRNPLHNIHMIGEALGRNATPTNAQLVDRLADNLKRLDQAVGLVYELSRPNRQADGIALEAIVLRTLMEEVIEEVGRRWSWRPASCTLPPAGLRANARRDSLHIALVNLLRNAFEVAESGVTLTSGHDEARVWIEIANPGRFPAAVLDGESVVDSEKSDGLGVGVGIARHLIERLGGTLILANRDGHAVSHLALDRWREGELDNA